MIKGVINCKFKKRDKKERQVKRSDKMGIERERVKPLTPTRATDDALIGDEEQTGKRRTNKKEEKKQKNRITIYRSY